MKLRTCLGPRGRAIAAGWSAAIFTGAVLHGCETNSPSGVSIRDRLSESPAPASRSAIASTANARPAAAPKPIAFVNDAPIDRGELIDLLIRTKGLALLQQIILRDLAVQETARRKLAVSEADVMREYDLTLQAEHMNGKDVENLTPARRDQLIDEWTKSRGVSREELQIAMRRQAHLRKLVADRVTISESMLRKEFDRVHGEKVEVRHIQIAAPRFYPQIKSRLDKGERFEDLVTQFSQNSVSRANGGLLPPFAAGDDTVPAVFSTAAFALQPGEYSKPIEAEGSFHVLKLERRIPPDATTFEAAKESLRHRLTARLMNQAVQEEATRLLMQARLRIEEPAIREQYKAAQASGQINGPVLIGQ